MPSARPRCPTTRPPGRTQRVGNSRWADSGDARSGAERRRVGRAARELKRPKRPGELRAGNVLSWRGRQDGGVRRRRRGGKPWPRCSIDKGSLRGSPKRGKPPLSPNQVIAVGWPPLEGQDEHSGKSLGGDPGLAGVGEVRPRARRRRGSKPVAARLAWALTRSRRKGASLWRDLGIRWFRRHRQPRLVGE